MKKAFHLLHLWLGLPLGIIFSVLCISGATLVFEQEINQLLYPSRYKVAQIGTERLSITQLVAEIVRQEPEAAVTSIQFNASPKATAEVMLEEGKRIFVDPYTGKITGEVDRRKGFFATMRHLHRWLLDPDRKVGKAVVGWSTIGVVLILISGIVIWIPKSRKELKARTRIKRNSTKRFLTDLHNSLGIYLVGGLLLLALTGLNWSFPWYHQGFAALFGIEVQQRGGHGGGGHGSRGGAHGNNRSEQEEKPSINYAAWQYALDGVAATSNNYKSLSVSDGQVRASLNQVIGSNRAADTYEFDRDNGNIIEVKKYEDSPAAQKLWGWIHSLHLGTWAGIVSKILTFCIALLGATLPWTGLYLYIIKRRKPTPKARKPRSQAMA